MLGDKKLPRNLPDDLTDLPTGWYPIGRARALRLVEVAQSLPNRLPRLGREIRLTCRVFHGNHEKAVWLQNTAGRFTLRVWESVCLNCHRMA